MTSNVAPNPNVLPIERSAVSACLVCPPDSYRTSFLFNPWLDYRDDEVDATKARAQWDELVSTLNEHCTATSFIEPSDDSPAMVFTADGALVYWERRAIVLRNDGSRSYSESYFVRDWLRANGYGFESLPPQYTLDGGNIVRLSSSTYLVGLKPGSPGHAERYLGRLLKMVADATVLPLALSDRRYLHLDMVVGNLAGRGLLVYWDGLHPASREHLKRWASDQVPLIDVSEQDAARFACNTIATPDGSIVTGPVSDELAGRIAHLGLRPVRVDLSEFYKAGGGAKCLTLPFAYNTTD